jgi:hypothetical protein
LTAAQLTVGITGLKGEISFFAFLGISEQGKDSKSTVTIK